MQNNFKGSKFYNLFRDKISYQLSVKSSTTVAKKIKNIHLEQDLICRNAFGTYFGVSQTVFDRVWNSLTNTDDNSAVYISMEIGADPDVYHPLKDFLVKKMRVKTLKKIYILEFLRS